MTKDCFFFSHNDCYTVRHVFSGLRKHDVAFLISVRPPHDIGHKYDIKAPFIPQVGLMYVRGCEIEGMLDAEGKVIEEGKYIFLILHNYKK
jgi:intron-binding protein aquarius